MSTKSEQLAKTKKYKFYLGSDCRTSYDNAVEEVCKTAKYLTGEGYWDFYDLDQRGKKVRKKNSRTTLENTLQLIRTATGHVFNCMHSISRYYAAKASYDLLLKGDVNSFKQDAYVAAKLQILGADGEFRWFYAFFLPIVSDSPDLYQFMLITNKKWKEDSYNESAEKSISNAYLYKNVLLALAGDWQYLKARSKQFLDAPKKINYMDDYVQIPQHEFLLALSTGDIAGMEKAMHAMLEYKFARKTVYASGVVMFEFYLQYEAVMLGKIASYHGYNLNIDSAIAPKELMIYRPLDHYEDPYDFMTTFDYNDHQGWIDMWKARMAKAKVEEQTKKKWNPITWFK